MLHNLRTWLQDDALWRKVLRGLQTEFYHQTVTTRQIESYIAEHTGKDLTAFFNQYLRDTRIPVLEYKIKGKKFSYRYTHIVDGFNMPLRVMLNGGEKMWIYPSAGWADLKYDDKIITVKVDPNFYVGTNEVK